MVPLRHVFPAVLVIWLAAILQGRVSHALRTHGVQPDLPLIALACSALLVGGTRGILLGFWTGLLSAVTFPLTYGSLFVSRILAGAFAGSFGRSLIRDNFLVPPVMVFLTTLLADLLSILMAPGQAIHHVRHWAELTGGEVLYNTVLALPMYLFLRLLQVGRQQEDPFGRLS
jgi:rod shape-determining protein MreD